MKRFILGIALPFFVAPSAIAQQSSIEDEYNQIIKTHKENAAKLAENYNQAGKIYCRALKDHSVSTAGDVTKTFLWKEMRKDFPNNSEDNIRKLVYSDPAVSLVSEVVKKECPDELNKL
ncbi:MAG: hypothetical protein ABEI54_00820 [Candidatus Bipolaricaulia bacterium]